VRAALFVVDATLNDMEEVRNHTASRKALAVIVKVESPLIGEPTGEYLKLLPQVMVSPNASIDELPGKVWFARLGHA